MDKFGRNYVLEVGPPPDDPGGDSIFITMPFTLEFDITRNTLTSANVAQIKVYNLSKLNRNQIRHNASDYGIYRPVTLRAGYGNNMPEIFKGNISQAWSVRDGTTFITQMESFDGGFAYVNGITGTEFPLGTPQKVVLGTLAAGLPNVKPGAIGSFPGVLGRGNSYSGNTMQILGELSGGGAFIDGGKINILGTNEFIIAPTIVINPNSGLLGTPVLEHTIVHFDMIFEPRLFVGTSVLLAGFTESNFNGLNKITAVKHRGTISGAVCGSVVTTGQFFFSKILSPVPSATT